MEQSIKRNLLKYHVQSAMFCKHCGTILDVHTAVSVDVYNGPALKVSAIYDAKCADKILTEITPLVQSAGYTLEISDGRELFAKGKK